MKTKKKFAPVVTSIKTQHGLFKIISYSNNESSNPDIVLVHGDVNGKPDVVTRIQSECFTGHVFQSLSCDCNEQLQDSLKLITASENGILIYLRQEGRGIGLEAKLKSYILQKQGLDTVEANEKLGFAIDERKYDQAADILKDLNVESIHLLTNNPKKVQELKAYGINITKTLEVSPIIREENKRYLQTKIDKMGHTFKI